MIIVLKQGTTQQEIDTVTNAVVARGVSVSPIVGTEMTILGLTGDTSRIDPDQLESFHCVERIMKVAEPFKKANRAFHPAPSEIKIGNTVVGGKKLAIMAGPCSVESEEQMVTVAKAVVPVLLPRVGIRGAGHALPRARADRAAHRDRADVSLRH